VVGCLVEIAATGVTMFRSTRKKANRLAAAWTADATDHVVSLAWSPDGRVVAAAAGTGFVSLFDAATGAARTVIRAHERGATAVAFQPGGGALATAGMDGAARLWHPRTAAPVADLPGGGADWVERLAWSADGSRLAAGAGRVVRVWDSAGVQLANLAGHPSTVSDLAWRPGSDTLAALVYGGVMLWTLHGDGPPTFRLFPWKGSPLRMAWSPDGTMLAHGNQDATVHFWYAETGEDLQMSGYPTKVLELSWDPTSRFLATGGGHVVCVWDCGGSGPQGSTPQMLDGHAEGAPLAAVQYQRRGHLLASAGADGQVCLWQPANKKQPLVGEADGDGEATALCWSPDDRFLAAGYDSGAVAVYRVV